MAQLARTFVAFVAFAAAQALATTPADVGPGVSRFVFHPTDPNVIYAGTDAGVFVTRDQGLRWRRQGLAQGVVVDLVMHPKNPDMLFAAVDGRYITGLHQSSDGGHTWKRLPLGSSGVRAFALDRARPHVMLAITAPGSTFEGLGNEPDRPDLYRSADGGATWQMIIRGSDRPVGGVAIAQNGTILVGSAGIVLRSSDDGKTWRESPRLEPDLMWVANVHIDPNRPNVAYAKSGWGDVMSSDGGATWTRTQGCHVFPPTEGASLVFALCADPTRKSLIGGLSVPGLLQKTTDGGRTWTRVQKGSPATSQAANIASHPLALNVVFASFQGGGVYKSADGGQSWKPACSGIVWKDLPGGSPQGLPISSCAEQTRRRWELRL